MSWQIGIALIYHPRLQYGHARWDSRASLSLWLCCWRVFHVRFGKRADPRPTKTIILGSVGGPSRQEVAALIDKINAEIDVRNENREAANSGNDPSTDDLARGMLRAAMRHNVPTVVDIAEGGPVWPTHPVEPPLAVDDPTATKRGADKRLVVTRDSYDQFTVYCEACDRITLRAGGFVNAAALKCPECGLKERRSPDGTYNRGYACTYCGRVGIHRDRCPNAPLAAAQVLNPAKMPTPRPEAAMPQADTVSRSRITLLACTCVKCGADLTHGGKCKPGCPGSIHAGSGAERGA